MYPPMSPPGAQIHVSPSRANTSTWPCPATPPTRDDDGLTENPQADERARLQNRHHGDQRVHIGPSVEPTLPISSELGRVNDADAIERKRSRQRAAREPAGPADLPPAPRCRGNVDQREYER
jgi:hypothetical protein